MGLTWEISLDELKKILACDSQETYKQFKRFNDRLLKPTCKDIQEKTECRFMYEPIKKGRSVVAIRFTLESLRDRIEDVSEVTDIFETQVTVEHFLEDLDQSKECAEYLIPLKFFQFSNSQLEELQSMIENFPRNYFEDEEARLNYTKTLVARLKNQMEMGTKKIYSKFGYIKKLIQNDLDQSKGFAQNKSIEVVPQKITGWNNAGIIVHKYDMEKLEEELLQHE
jgi:plasmid replication initiation protein